MQIAKNNVNPESLNDSLKDNVRGSSTIAQEFEKLIGPAAQAVRRGDMEQIRKVLAYEQHVWGKKKSTYLGQEEKAYAQGMKAMMEGILDFMLASGHTGSPNALVGKHKEALPLLYVLGMNARAGRLFAASLEPDRKHKPDKDSDVVFENSSMNLAELVKATGVKMRCIVDIAKEMGRYDLVKIGSKDGALRIVITECGIDVLNGNAPGWKRMVLEQVCLIAERAVWK